MEEENPRQFIEIDSKIGEIGEKLNYLLYINPTNSQSEKEKFFDSNFVNEPEFKYKNLDIDTWEIKSQLENIEIPKGSFENLIKKKIKFVKIQCDLIGNINNPSFLNLSKKLFGCPKPELVAKAYKILKLKTKIKKDEKRKKISSLELKELMEKCLKDYSLKDWKIILSKNYSTSVLSNIKSISICQDREFDEIDIRRLLMHEIEVHVLRSENGSNQVLPFCFQRNDSESLGTEEGLAIYTQVKNDLMPNGSWRSIASSVIIIDSLVNGKSFVQTFNLLKSLGLSDEFSWRKCLRTYRGGGLTKDYIYLEGYLKIEEFVRKGGSIRDLYIGKISISDLEWTKPLVEKGILKEARHLPNFLEK